MNGTANESGGAQTDRYATFRTGDGDIVVYDKDNPSAWVQSDLAVEVGSQ